MLKAVCVCVIKERTPSECPQTLNFCAFIMHLLSLSIHYYLWYLVYSRAYNIRKNVYPLWTSYAITIFQFFTISNRNSLKIFYWEKPIIDHHQLHHQHRSLCSIFENVDGISMTANRSLMYRHAMQEEFGQMWTPIFIDLDGNMRLVLCYILNTS